MVKIAFFSKLRFAGQLVWLDNVCNVCLHFKIFAQWVKKLKPLSGTSTVRQTMLAVDL